MQMTIWHVFIKYSRTPLFMILFYVSIRKRVAYIQAITLRADNCDTLSQITKIICYFKDNTIHILT